MITAILLAFIAIGCGGSSSVEDPTRSVEHIPITAVMTSKRNLIACDVALTAPVNGMQIQVDSTGSNVAFAATPGMTATNSRIVSANPFTVRYTGSSGSSGKMTFSVTANSSAKGDRVTFFLVSDSKKTAGATAFVIPQPAAHNIPLTASLALTGYPAPEEYIITCTLTLHNPTPGGRIVVSRDTSSPVRITAAPEQTGLNSRIVSPSPIVVEYTGSGGSSDTMTFQITAFNGAGGDRATLYFANDTGLYSNAGATVLIPPSLFR
jgi:hypothetical protein